MSMCEYRDTSDPNGPICKAASLYYDDGTIVIHEWCRKSKMPQVSAQQDYKLFPNSTAQIKEQQILDDYWNIPSGSE